MTSEFQIVQITGLILEEQTQLSLDDLCRACEAQADRIVELVDEGVLAAVGNVPEHWRSTGCNFIAPALHCGLKAIWV